MKIDELKELLLDFKSNVVFNQDLKNKNWFNIGGRCKVFFKAENLNNLIKFLKILENREKISIIGAGSNTLITDEVYDGVVIKLGKNFNKISLLNENIIISGTAVLDKNLANFAMENRLSGFEFLTGIPGTIGGGIRMNAGCFGSEIKDILISVQALDRMGNLSTIPSDQIKFEYRNNNLSENLIFLSASFKGEKGDIDEIKKKIHNIKSRKENNQPSRIKTSGSTFKNPVGQTHKKAWELIKESVPSNLNFGMLVSRKTFNFFVNKAMLHLRI